MRATSTAHVLAIGVRAGDVEQTCGGTLLAMAERGYRTAIVDLAGEEDGSRSGSGPPTREAREAARILGTVGRRSAGLPSDRLENTPETREQVAAVIRDLRPSVVVLPYWEAHDPVHSRCSRIGYEACFVAGHPATGSAGQPHRPTKILFSTQYADVRPSFVVDVSRHFERRLQALLTCRPTLAGGPATRDRSGHAPADPMRMAARHYGAMIGAEYGEPFALRGTMAVDDIVRLRVRSL